MFGRQDRPEVDEWTQVHLRMRGMKTAEDVFDEAVKLQEDIDAVRVEAENQMRWEAMDLEELDAAASELDITSDDPNDDYHYIESLKQRRLAQLQEQAMRARFGTLKSITKEEYKDAVEDTSCNTVVLLHREYIQASLVVRARLQELAKKFPEVKFLIIKAEDCINNYPDKCVPTLLVYREGHMVKQLVGAEAVGGREVTQDELEWKLAELDVLKTELESDPARPADTGIRGIQLSWN